MKYEELQALLSQADAAKTIGNYQATEQIVQKILDHVSRTKGDTSKQREEAELHSSALLLLAEIAVRGGNYADALEKSKTILSLAEEYSIHEVQIKALNTIGNVYQFLHRHDEALEYYSRVSACYDYLGDKLGVARATMNIGNIHFNTNSFEKSLECYTKAREVFEEHHDRFSIAMGMSNIGLVHSTLGDFDTSLEYYAKSLATFEELDEEREIARVTGYIGTLYWDLENYNKALEYMFKALAINEELGNRSGVASVTSNIGGIYANLREYDKALEYLHKACAIHEELGEKSGVALVTGNLGSTYTDTGNYHEALEYLFRALALDEELEERYSVAIVTGNIGLLYATQEFAGCDVVKAEEYYLKSIALSKELGSNHHLVSVHKSLSQLYKEEKRWEDFAIHFEQYHELEKIVLSEKAKKSADAMEHRRQVAQREKEIEIERTRATAEKNILNNILPEEITARLIKGESPIADHFDCVSVLFMDIVDFTPLASSITAQQLVHLLNAIFSAADGVMREFGLEKIKTIGDAYMAVAGAPVVQEDHAERAANAALNLLEVMDNLVVTFPDNYGDRSWIESIPEIKVRIGLHCGPVAAGVVGENKFLYDLWGDAVNTAARMESHGEEGKIHVSDEFMKTLSSAVIPAKAGIHFSERGEMEIKGKEMMQTYFLERSDGNG